MNYYIVRVTDSFAIVYEAEIQAKTSVEAICIMLKTATFIDQNAPTVINVDVDVV